ncbi:MAG: hypothetical protein KC492_26600 [Myxococcales bacterium]|nr:hypothetical protein [Myxococcales bacterium]
MSHRSLQVQPKLKLLASLLCVVACTFGAASLTACGNGDTCSQCNGGSGGGGNGGSANGGSGNSNGGGAGSSTGGGNASANVIAYCECMLSDCHDEYHATWGEDHIAAEEQCHAEAGMVPEQGSPTEVGDFIECRLAACQRAQQDPTACAAAMGGGVCAAAP